MHAMRSGKARRPRNLAALVLGAAALAAAALVVLLLRSETARSDLADAARIASGDETSGREALDYELPAPSAADAPAGEDRATLAPDTKPAEPLDSPDNPYQVRGSVRLSNEKSPRMLVHLRMVDERGNVARPEWAQSAFYFGPGLHAGAWTLSVAASPEVRELHVPIELNPEAPVQRRELVLLRPREIAVRFVTPEGRDLLEVLAREKLGISLLPIVTLALPGAEIDVDALPRRFGEVHSAWRGPGGAPGPPDSDNLACTGIFYVLHELPVFLSVVSGTAVLATRTIYEGTSLVEFVIAPALIRSVLSSADLRVVDSETGRPLAGAQVALGGSSTVTDPGGEARFERQVCGWRNLVIGLQGYGTSRSRIRLVPGSSLHLGVLRLQPAMTICGRVVDREDRPAEAQLMAIRVADPEANGGQVVWSGSLLGSTAASSADDGSFVFSDLSPGRYALRASGRGAMSETVIADTAGGPKDGVTLRLRPCGGVELRVPSFVRESYDVSVFDSKSVLVARREGVRATGSILLPPGAYTVRAASSSGGSGSNSFEVETGLHTMYLSW